MWRQRKLWEPPTNPWQKTRIEEEKKLMKEYGLKNKREIWRAESIIRRIRYYVRYLNARKAAGFDVSKQEEAIKRKLIKYGLLSENSDITEALNLSVRDILERRLQTLVYRSGLANTIKQARQLIVHKHIKVNGKVINSPGYLVTKDEESKIEYNEYKPVNIQKPQVSEQKQEESKEQSNKENQKEESKESTEQNSS